MQLKKSVFTSLRSAPIVTMTAGLIILTVGCASTGQKSGSPSESDAPPPPLVYEGEQDWFRNVRALTDSSMGIHRAGEAYFSADGKRVCFQAYPDGKDAYQIYVINSDGTGLKMVSTGQGATTCAYFHPDGKRMLFGSNHLDQRPPIMPEEIRKIAEKAQKPDYVWPFPPGMDVFEYTFATGKLERLISTDGYDAEASYSPDGKRLIFTSMRDDDQEIYVSDADGTNAHRITNVKGYDGGPFFSPGGDRIVYRSDRVGNGNLQIYTNNLEGTDEKMLTPDPDILHWCPFWHPSGKWLIFTRADHRGRPNYDLYLLRDDGSEVHRITRDPRFDGLPVFSPDGKKLMWTSKRGDGDTPHIFIADFIGVTPAGKLTFDPQ